MKKSAVLISVVLLGLILFGCAEEDAAQAGEMEESAVRILVESFGGKLSMVSLSAQDVKKSMEDHYGDYVTPSLLEKWQNDPQNAPGILDSESVPDHIEILSVERETSDIYQVTGNIVESTDSEQSGDVFSKRSVSIEVKEIGSKWMIDDLSFGESVGAEAVTYENIEYGFTFTLPGNWKGYSIVAGQWDGASLEDGKVGQIVESGPELSIRHPEWTEAESRQDIPIMVFTIAQWDAMESGKFHIGAAPIDPSELGRNSAYVFALPARYNYAFPTGYEEVEDILKGNPLKPNEIYGSTSSTQISTAAPSSSVS